MTTFDERLKGYETKFVHDKMIEFKVQARRNRLLGEWVAEKLHLDAERTQEYALDVVQSDIDEPGDKDVVGKILTDLSDAGIELTEDDLRKEMRRFDAVALEQVKNEE